MAVCLSREHVDVLMRLVSKILEETEDPTAFCLADKVLKLLWLAEELMKEDTLPASLRPKVEMILWQAEDLAKENALPLAVKARVESIAFGVNRRFGEAFSLTDGCCPRCGGDIFDTSVQVNGWGTCLVPPLENGPFYCEQCGHRVRID